MMMYAQTRVFFVMSRDGLLPGADTVYQDGDLVHVVTTASALQSVEQTLDETPPVH